MRQSFIQWFYCCCGLWWFCGFPLYTTAQDSALFLLFLQYCGEGNTEEVINLLKDHPEWATAASPEGETCLHIAGIHGRPDVTRAVLDAGADPNQLTKMTGEEGDRVSMTALSWHVFGGHVETVKMLLEHGADPNQLMDTVSALARDRMTVLDLVDDLLKSATSNDEDFDKDDTLPYQQMKELLLQHGARRRDEL